jgi:hypothetical protein
MMTSASSTILHPSSLRSQQIYPYHARGGEHGGIFHTTIQTVVIAHMFCAVCTDGKIDSLSVRFNKKNDTGCPARQHMRA